MFSVNLYDDHINIYNIKRTLFKIFMQLRIFEKYLKYFINQKINKLICFKEHAIPTLGIEKEVNESNCFIE